MTIDLGPRPAHFFTLPANKVSLVKPNQKKTTFEKFKSKFKQMFQNSSSAKHRTRTSFNGSPKNANGKMLQSRGVPVYNSNRFFVVSPSANPPVSKLPRIPSPELRSPVQKALVNAKDSTNLSSKQIEAPQPRVLRSYSKKISNDVSKENRNSLHDPQLLAEFEKDFTIDTDDTAVVTESGGFEENVYDVDVIQKDVTVVDASDQDFAIGSAFLKVVAVAQDDNVNDVHPDTDADNIFVDPDKSKDSEKNWMDTSGLSIGGDFSVTVNDCYNEDIDNSADASVGSSVPTDDVISLGVADQRIIDLENISTPCSVRTSGNQFLTPENDDYEDNLQLADLSEICDNGLSSSDDSLSDGMNDEIAEVLNISLEEFDLFEELEGPTETVYKRGSKSSSELNEIYDDEALSSRDKDIINSVLSSVEEQIQNKIMVVLTEPNGYWKLNEKVHVHELCTCECDNKNTVQRPLSIDQALSLANYDSEEFPLKSMIDCDAIYETVMAYADSRKLVNHATVKGPVIFHAPYDPVIKIPRARSNSHYDRIQPMDMIGEEDESSAETMYDQIQSDAAANDEIDSLKAQIDTLKVQILEAGMHVKRLDTMCAKKEVLLEKSQINNETYSELTTTSIPSVSTITPLQRTTLIIPTSNIIHEAKSEEVPKHQKLTAEGTMKSLSNVASVFTIPNPGCSPISKFDHDTWDDIFESSDSDSEDPIFSSIDSYSY
ncbi:unnamed protein product [Ambrosiozyma monospora]|uniref:Unnamed protein product n=1 Tax=Ambrosiozyma monospora TaxID=43982 RepID=A0A9W6YT35_AMBMO|nr:unnamed protein product [Ambrosiozyma monospora]